MSYGCPVVSSDSSCLPEILGSAAAYFRDNQMDSAIKVIDGVLGSQKQRQVLVEAGFQQITKYSWDICAQQTLAIYQQILNK
jgi:glycosyltransferase involved in cell wall biosynthesis